MFQKVGKTLLLLVVLTIAVIGIEKGLKAYVAPAVNKVSPSLATFLVA